MGLNTPTPAELDEYKHPTRLAQNERPRLGGRGPTAHSRHYYLCAYPMRYRQHHKRFLAGHIVLGFGCWRTLLVNYRGPIHLGRIVLGSERLLLDQRVHNELHVLQS